MGGKLCKGDNGLFERKIFYFKQPKNPEKYYKKKLQEKYNGTIEDSGNWCTPYNVNEQHNAVLTYGYHVDKSDIRHLGDPSVRASIKKMTSDKNKFLKNIKRMNRHKRQSFLEYKQSRKALDDKFFNSRYNRTLAEQFTSDEYNAKWQELDKNFEEEREWLDEKRNKAIANFNVQANGINEKVKQMRSFLKISRANIEWKKKGDLWKEINHSYFDLHF